MVKVKVAKPKISLIVPVCNDEAQLPELLDSAAAARRRYQPGERGIEFIVVDRGSTDDTVAVARARGCRVTEAAHRTLGFARNAGAREARGEVLAFVVAAFEIDPETFNAVDEAVEQDRACGGVTGAVVDSTDARLRGPWRRVVSGIRRALGIGPGLVFCDREIFESVGGFGDHRHVPDEARFLKAVAAAGKADGRPLVRLDRPVRVAMSRLREAGFAELIREMPSALSWRLFLRRAFRAAGPGKAKAGRLSDVE